jgi:N-acetylglucosamine kinase-like BadF-type ATPase
MILIADSGSTKTDWKCTDGTGNIAAAKTGGINPQYMSEGEIAKEMREANTQMNKTGIKAIYFYGAGCSSQEKKEMVSRQLSELFPDAVIGVNGDLLGAARATCLNQPGIACILGTGSGSCVYDGERIVKSIPSLGFILADEGSGAYLGKQLVRDFLREEMPGELIDMIRTNLGITKEIILENVNRKPMPSRYLAGFSRFIHENINHIYIEDLVYHGFEEFVFHYITRYKESNEYPIHFVGSIAQGFKGILKAVLESKSLLLGKIVEAPINGLIEYHMLDYNYTT